MIRGVSFEIAQILEDCVLGAVLKNVHVEKYKWYNLVEQNEVWSDSTEKNLLEQSEYEGIDFLEEIQLKYYIVFLKLQAYNQEEKFYNIHTYEEFLESECQILLLIYDSEFIEIYAKDMKVISSIYENAIKIGYKNVDYITDDNDMRTQMDIME